MIILLAGLCTLFPLWIGQRFGTVPLIRTRWEVVRRQTILFASFAVAIVLIPAVLWFIHVQVIPLDTIAVRIKDKVGL